MNTDTQTEGFIGTPDRAEAWALGRAGRLLALADLIWIVQAGLIAWALGHVLSGLAGPSDGGGPQAVLMPLLACTAGIVLTALLRVALQMRGLAQARKVAGDIQTRTRQALLTAAVARSPADSFPSSGAFSAHVTDQIDLLGPYYRTYIPQLTRLKTVPLAIVLVTACFSWLAALILLVTGPVIPVFMALIGSRAKAASEGQQEELTRLSGVLLDRIKGLETLTLFGAVDFTRSEIASAGERFRLGTMRVLKVAFLSSTVLELFSALGIAFAAVYIGFSLLGDIRTGTWGGPLGYSAGLFMLLLAPEFFAPLRAFSAAYHDRAAGLAACQKLSELAVELGGIQTVAGDATAAPVSSGQPLQVFRSGRAPRLAFENMSLAHGDQTVFRNFHLQIASGETVFLTGRSGSGKTTLIDCVLGFRKPQQGRVLVEGMDAGALSKGLRQKVMWLGQAPQLFHGSLKANLLKAAVDPETVSEADLWQALHLAGAQSLVEGLPNGLATRLGENGFGLSVGEIRRIALARAALRQDALILLADEPTAGLDAQTAADVIAGLKILAKGRTALIATHNPAVLDLPGRVLDLDSLDGTAAREAAS